MEPVYGLAVELEGALLMSAVGVFASVLKITSGFAYLQLNSSAHFSSLQVTTLPGLRLALDPCLEL